MVVQRTIDNLKGRPEDERKAVAGGLAIFVIIMLIIVWGIFFFRNIQNGSRGIDFDSAIPDGLNFTGSQSLEGSAQDTGKSDLIRMRDDAAARKVQDEQGIYLQEIEDTGDQFINPSR
jgi:hypothetical protein